MGRLKLVLIALLALMIIASPIMASAPVPDPDVVVPSLRVPVVLDGVITGGEWSDAARISVTFIFNDPGATTRSGAIYLKHDCQNLWICLVIEDPNENTGEWMCVFYDVVVDGFLPGGGDDEKAMFHPDTALDIAIIPPMTWDNDTDIGGTLDIQGASGWFGGVLTYEFVHPLNSGDAAGNDPKLEPGDTILALFLVGDPGIGIDYYGGGGRYDLILTLCPPVGGVIIQTDYMALLIPALASATLTFALVWHDHHHPQTKRK